MKVEHNSDQIKAMNKYINNMRNQEDIIVIDSNEDGLKAGVKAQITGSF